MHSPWMMTATYKHLQEGVQFKATWRSDIPGSPTSLERSSKRDAGPPFAAISVGGPQQESEAAVTDPGRSYSRSLVDCLPATLSGTLALNDAMWQNLQHKEYTDRSVISCECFFIYICILALWLVGP
jgi:hypothetical protein